METAQRPRNSGEHSGGLLADFTEARNLTLELFGPLNVEDAVIQSDSFGSPPNWHIAHVTWFFHKVLEKYSVDLSGASLNLDYLNSYYQKYGGILPKAERGRFPRPTVQQTLQYREFIDGKVSEFLQSDAMSAEAAYDITLGIQHEMQHQELMIYDLQHYFERFSDPADNYIPHRRSVPRGEQMAAERPAGMVFIPGGLYELGFSGRGFSYDNELPEHKVFLYPFRIDVAPVTNGEFAEFIDAGGYHDYKYWLADGWELVRENGWQAPLYWRKDEGKWVKKDFAGSRDLVPDEPVVNVSYFEADAFARWKGKRLPTEAEWEKAASWSEELGRKTLYPWGDELPTAGHANLLESYEWQPSPVGSYPLGRSHYGCHQMIGDVWEWTSSEYVLYPGFMSRFPEYTDKWAVGQKVLRGGCFATPRKQIRTSYRNYFKPHERILFAGFRCAQDADR
ncbi:MAG: ergothioneine biosynthesis protein EgtB [Nitrososphaera sp.]